jgi:hypothetical protein
VLMAQTVLHCSLTEGVVQSHPHAALLALLPETTQTRASGFHGRRGHQDKGGWRSYGAGRRLSRGAR